MQDRAGSCRGSITSTLPVNPGKNVTPPCLAYAAPTCARRAVEIHVTGPHRPCPTSLRRRPKWHGMRCGPHRVAEKEYLPRNALEFAVAFSVPAHAKNASTACPGGVGFRCYPVGFGGVN